MRRLPIIPTLIVAVAVAVMIGLGVWQIERAQWKERLLAQYVRNAGLPPVDLDPLIAGGDADLTRLAFRRALVSCRSDGSAPEMRAGRSAADESGYSYIVPCRPGASGLAGRLTINAGWSQRPDAAKALPLDGIVAGTLGAVEKEGPITLTSAAGAGPLQPSEPPSIAEIPNNHLSYAFQWFFFAAAAVVIYVLALRRRQNPSG